jgi:hypothetical protein
VKFAAAWIAASCLAFGQLSSLITVGNGVQIEITADLGKPTGQQQLTVEMARATGQSFYRIFRDQNKLAVFAYELKVDLASDGKALTVVAKPAENDFAARFPNADAGKPVPTLSSDHALGALSSGESGFLGLFEIPGMGIKLTDTVLVKLNQPGGGTGSLRLAGARVTLNRQPITGNPPPSTVAGKFVMFYIPGRGGFFFSAEQVPGRPFEDIGTIEGRRLRFTVNNDNYECTATQPILPQGENGQVWVYNDPSYVPESNWTQDPHSATPGAQQFFTAGSDSLGWWLK